MRTERTLVFLCLLVVTLPAAAQNHELAFTAGGHFPVGIEGLGVGAAIQGNYAKRLVNAEVAALQVEFPVVVGFRISSELPALFSQGHYSSLFITPALKLKIAPGFFVSPWLSAGGGWARFRAEEEGTTNVVVTNRGVFQLGGGLDFKVAPAVSLRGEIRDFYSAPARLPFPLPVGNQHHILIGGGIVLRL